MRITELAIKRPAATAIVFIFFIVMGLMGYQRLGADLYPRTNVPYVSIAAVYPGAGAQEIESQVVDPLEEAVASLSGLRNTTSVAYEGMAVTVLEFDMDSDADVAAMDVQKAVDSVYYRLPEDVSKPVVSKYNINDQPVMTLVLSGTRPLPLLYRLAQDEVQPQLESVPGVGKVTLVGGQDREIQVRVDRARLESYGLSINQVAARLALENFNMPAGSLTRQDTEFTVRLLGQFSSLKEIEDLRIPLASGASIALKDVASVSDGQADVQEKARLNGKQAIGIIVQKQSDASIVNTAEAVQQRISRITAQLPSEVELTLAQNNATFIRDSLNDTRRSLLEGVLMTGLVLLLFLRQWRSTLIVMLAIPTSLVATFFMMYFAGFSFNMLSLMGLALCVGILVDDSIVVLENIHRHGAMGKDPETAAIEGRGEIGTAAVAITMQDVVVFLPIAFMTGLVGQFFRQFGLTVVFATLFSLLVSFTLTPMLAARLAPGQARAASRRDRTPAPVKRFLAWWSVRSVRLLDSYRGLLVWSLEHRRVVVGIVGLALLVSVSLVPLGPISTEFIPTPDQSQFSVDLELPPGTPLARTDEMARRLEERISSLPEVKDCFSVTGSGNDLYTKGSNYARVDVMLVPKRERRRSVWQVADEVRGWKSEYAGLRLTVREAVLVGLDAQGSPVQLQVVGPDQAKLAVVAEQIQRVVEETPGTVDVRSTWKAVGQPEVQVVVDRVRAAAFGLSAGEIAQAMRTAMAGDVATRYREAGEEYDLRLRLDKVNMTSVADVGEIKVSNAMGMLVPINQIADIKMGSGPPTISHLNRQRLITITANIRNRPLGAVTGDIQESLASINLPEGYSFQFYGEQKQMEDSFSDLIQALILALLLVYMILVILYESFLTPLVRMLSLPCGAIGALWALYLTGSSFNIMSMIGILMLDGLAAKSGTLLVDYTNTLMKRGMSLRDALLEAGTTRLRPIVMTAATMIAGMMPTALALAEGSEIRKTMAIVIVGGLVTTTLLTPVLIPVAYTLMDDFSRMVVRLRRMPFKLQSPDKGL